MGDSDDRVNNLWPRQFFIAPGATLAQLIDSSAYGAGVVATIVKPLTGGSLQIFGFTAFPGPGAQFGQTLTAAQLGAGWSAVAYWPLDTSLALDGPARFYVGAQGTTGVLALLVGRTTGV